MAATGGPNGKPTAVPITTSIPPPPRVVRPGPWPSAGGNQPVAAANNAASAPAPATVVPASPAAGAQQMPPASWAKRTGFKGRVSGESGEFIIPTRSTTTREGSPQPHVVLDLEAGGVAARPAPSASPQATAAPLGNARSENGGSGRVTFAPSTVGGLGDKDPGAMRKRRDSDGAAGVPGHNGQGRPHDPSVPPPPARPIPAAVTRREMDAGTLRTVQEEEDLEPRRSHIKYELRDRPGLVPIAFYGLQHYLSLLGSIILIPLVLVPAMGGTQEDTSAVVSTVLFITGLTTLLHTSFGSRLPLVQGPSFVYLAPALAIIHSQEFLGLTTDKFRHTMKELQGAIIVAAAFQTLMGYTGLMSVFLRLVNPVVVSPTIAAVGLSFFGYGVTQVGTCLEIGIVQILVAIIFSLYLRKISLFGHRIFLIYAVPLGLAVTWAVAFLLTEIGLYSYKGCDLTIPTSNVVSDYCRKHVSRMKHCRVDTSRALKSSPWVKVPYPLQWGVPIFSWKMAIVMCVASVIASVDSVGTYHASSLLVASRPPTAGVLSRGIGMEGLCSVLAGLWGTGTGSATLTENIHTIAVTKMGSRRGVEVGALIMILLSFVGKVGGFIASIPDVMVAALLCFMWAMLAALGLSNLRYSEAGSSRNVIIVGLSLFFALSVPAYVQQYGTVPSSKAPVPSYFQPYIVASHGPIQTKFNGLNYVINTLLSLHMVIAFIVAVILDNTVPGSRQERGIYVWSETENGRREPALTKDYELPFRVGRPFRWVKWVGL